MQTTYSTKEAADLVGCTPQVLRQYTNKFPRHFSAHATPASGGVRRFTPEDVKLVAFIFTSTVQRGLSHEEVAQQLDSGALHDFDYELPTTAQQDATEQAQSETTQLVSVERLNAALGLFQREREINEQIHEEADQLRQRIEQLQRELGQKEGELSALKAQPQRRGWWARLWGGE